MMFKKGQKIKAIYIPKIDGGDSVIRVGLHGVTEIVVEMENGQMAGVPWFEVYSGDRMVCKWNAALCEGCEIMEDSP